MPTHLSLGKLGRLSQFHLRLQIENWKICRECSTRFQILIERIFLSVVTQQFKSHLHSRPTITLQIMNCTSLFIPAEKILQSPRQFITKLKQRNNILKYAALLIGIVIARQPCYLARDLEMNRKLCEQEISEEFAKKSTKLLSEDSNDETAMKDPYFSSCILDQDVKYGSVVQPMEDECLAESQEDDDEMEEQVSKCPIYQKIHAWLFQRYHDLQPPFRKNDIDDSSEEKNESESEGNQSISQEVQLQNNEINNEEENGEENETIVIDPNQDQDQDLASMESSGTDCSFQSMKFQTQNKSSLPKFVLEQLIIDQRYENKEHQDYF